MRKLLLLLVSISMAFTAVTAMLSRHARQLTSEMEQLNQREVRYQITLVELRKGTEIVSNTLFQVSTAGLTNDRENMPARIARIACRSECQISFQSPCARLC